MLKRAQSSGGVSSGVLPHGDSPEDRVVVEREREALRDFVDQLSADDVRTGGWFAKLLTHAMSTYTEKVDWQYFQQRYRGLPPDAIVEQRIRMASRYAAIEGGLSAGAYTSVVAATIGTLGGASPLTVPAAVSTLMLDLVYTTKLQLQLAYDISVLYGVPLDPTDPDDLWKLIRVAFTIRTGEVVRESVVKAAPAMMRPLIKRFYSNQVLKAARGLPVVGKYLLQRNAIKVGIPLVGVPLAVVLNRQTTLIAGRHAREVFREEAHLREVADRLSRRTQHPECLLWVAWLVTAADAKTSDQEATLLRYLVQCVENHHGVVDDGLSRLITLDPDEVWRRIADQAGDKSDLVRAAETVALVDGDLTSRERVVLAEITRRCNGG